MGFKKYDSIENSYRTRTVNDISKTAAIGDYWFITEKIHGTNMTWIFGRDGNVQIAKRTGIIPHDELQSFYRADLAYAEAKQYADALAADMIENEWKEIRIVGEWYGGGCANTPKVQSGIDYGNTLRFAAFDVFVEYDDGTSRVMGTVGFFDFCDYHNIPTVPLVKGYVSFDEALAIDVENFHTTIGTSNDIAEGVVIKPNHPEYLRTGQRVILKKKYSKFSEKAHGRSGEPREVKPIEFDGVGVAELYATIDDYFTVNRYNNMIGNLGEGLHMGQYIKYFVDDVLGELYNVITDENISVSESDLKHIKKYVGKSVPKWLTTETNILTHIA